MSDQFFDKGLIDLFGGQVIDYCVSEGMEGFTFGTIRNSQIFRSNKGGIKSDRILGGLGSNRGDWIDI